jgi:hypothetical protein
LFKPPYIPLSTDFLNIYIDLTVFFSLILGNSISSPILTDPSTTVPVTTLIKICLNTYRNIFI